MPVNPYRRIVTIPKKKNPHAVALGRRGGLANTERQAESRAANGRLSPGRPRTKIPCAKCEALGVRCRHRETAPPHR